MSIICPACNYEKNLPDAEFCEACGEALTPNPHTETVLETPEEISSQEAKLMAIQGDCPVQEFLLNRPSMIIGKFDPDSGPVDINLEKFPDQENISRKHAEIFQERGEWKIQDIGSVNGVFIRRNQQKQFGARITMPETLNSGDEIAIAQTFFRFQII